MSDAALESRLAALGESMVFPGVDSLVDDVLERLEDEVVVVRPWGRALLVAAAMVLALAITVAVMPAPRRAVAHWLGFGDFRIEPFLDLPAIPDEATVTGTNEIPGPELSVWTAVVDGTRVLFAELPGTLEHGLFTKRIGRDATVTPTTVDGEPAFWIDGAPHALLYVDADGDHVEARLSGRVLVWQHGEVIRRVEGDLTLRRARELAEREW